MPDTHPTPTLDAADADGAIEAIRAQGMRASAARRLLVEALFAADGPASAEEIAQDLHGRGGGGDVASVYRNLDELERIGLVRHIHLGHGPALYALAGQIAPAYLLCEVCGSREALSQAELGPLRRSLRSRFGFDASFKHFPISGLCGKCDQERPS